MESINKEDASAVARALRDEGTSNQRDARATLRRWLAYEALGAYKFEEGARELIEPFIDKV